MKYGVCFFKKTTNLGDDIQTYAALRFLPNVDYVIEREEMNEFVPDKDEMVTMIMNGWFNHNMAAFPPSPFINPLIISSHFTDCLKKEKPIYFDEFFIDFIRRHEPIGLRDDVIKGYLDDLNIKNYFSGCLTLTILPFKDVKKGQDIIAVDVDDEICNIVEKTTNSKVIKMTHKVNPHINSNLSFEERMKNVENVLKKYQSSKLVITTRLHVALPCLSIGVPVLLIYDKDSVDIKNRLGTYLKYVNYCSKDEFLKTPKLKVENKSDFLKLRDNLEEKVKKFIDDSKKNNNITKDNIKLYKEYYINRKNHEKLLSENEIDKYRKTALEYEKEYYKLDLLYKFECAENEYLTSRCYELQFLRKSYLFKPFKAIVIVNSHIKNFLRRVKSKINRVVRRRK